MDVVVGIDLGTTGAKALLVDASGRTVASGYQPYPSAAVEDHHEQDPADWWDATVGAIRQGLGHGVAAASVRAVGLSGHMHAVALIDASDRWVRPVMTWADRRSGPQVARLRAHAELFAQRCANPVVEAFTAPKVAWMAEHEPEHLERAVRLVQPKDALRHRLTGTWGTDVSDARGTLLFDVHRNEWDRELWELCGADARLAPPVAEATDVVGAVTAEAARATGLMPGTPVVAGAADVAASALGAGAHRTGLVYVNVGTAAQILAPLEHAVVGDHFVFGQAGSGAYLAMASVYAAGLAVDWAARLLRGPDATGEHLDRLAGEAAAGSSGVVFVPHLLGLSVPSHNASVRGGLVDLAADHGPPAVARAVLEGVAYACAEAIDHVAAVAGGTREVRVGGGLVRSSVWAQTLAAVVDAPIRRLTEPASPIGAVILAGVGAGVWPDVQTAVDACVTLRDVGPIDDDSRRACARARRRHAAALESLTRLADELPRGDC